MRVLLFILAFAVQTQARQFQMRSLVYTGYWHNAYSVEANKAYIQDLLNIGANTASILVTCWTTDTTTYALDCNHKKSPTTESIVDVVLRAKQAGLKTNLRVHVDLLNEKPRMQWKPNNIAEGFKSLTAMNVDYAKIAENLKVDSLFIGAEYQLLTKPEYTSYWKMLISEVRKVYRGKLSYAALALSPGVRPEYEQVGFWQELDFVGINHYVGLLGTVKDPSLPVMIAHQKSIRNIFEHFISRVKKPYVLSEAGFSGGNDCYQFPWDWNLPGPADPEEQANGYTAQLEVFKNSSSVQGYFIWSRPASSDLGGGGSGINEVGFGLKDKPAFKVIKKYFTARNR